MAVRTADQLARQISNMIDSGGTPRISAADLRSVLTDIKDSVAYATQIEDFQTLSQIQSLGYITGAQIRELGYQTAAQVLAAIDLATANIDVDLSDYEVRELVFQANDNNAITLTSRLTVGDTILLGVEATPTTSGKVAYISVQAVGSGNQRYTLGITGIGDLPNQNINYETSDGTRIATFLANAKQATKAAVNGAGQWYWSDAIPAAGQAIFERLVDAGLPATRLQNALINRGAWAATNAYSPADVTHNGDVNYLSLQAAAANTGAVTEPGAGSDWQTYWLVLGHQVNNPDAFTGVVPGDDAFTLTRAGGTNPVEVSLAEDATPANQAVHYEELWSVTIASLTANNPTRAGSGAEQIILDDPRVTYNIFINIADDIGPLVVTITGQDLRTLTSYGSGLNFYDADSDGYIHAYTNAQGHLLVESDVVLDDVIVRVKRLVGGGVAASREDLYVSASTTGTDVSSQGGTSLIAGQQFSDYDLIRIYTGGSTANSKVSRSFDPAEVAVGSSLKLDRGQEFFKLSDTTFRIGGTGADNEGLFKIVGYKYFEHIPAPAPQPSITSFEVTGVQHVSAGTSLAGRRYTYATQVAQAAQAAAVRIVGYAGDAAASPASVAVLATLQAADFAHASGRVTIPAGIALANAGDAYNIRLEVYRTGQTVGTDAPVAYQDFRITAVAAASEVHFGFILSTEGAADIVFADDDLATGGTAAGSWTNSGIPETTDLYRNYLAVPAALDQPMGYASAGLDASNSWADAVDRTIGGIDYKIYLVKVAFAATGANLNGTTWTIS